jgi:rubrerythrin
VRAPISSIEEFYAHALAIEREAGERYTEFASWYDARGEDVLAGLCRNLAHMEHAHFLELARASAHLILPDIEAGCYSWLGPESPESGSHEDFMRVAGAAELLGIALHAECSAVEFFEWIARTAPDDGVRLLARGMAAEERQHVEWVRKALDYRPATV